MHNHWAQKLSVKVSFVMEIFSSRKISGQISNFCNFVSFTKAQFFLRKICYAWFLTPNLRRLPRICLTLKSIFNILIFNQTLIFDIWIYKENIVQTNKTYHSIIKTQKIKPTNILYQMINNILTLLFLLLFDMIKTIDWFLWACRKKSNSTWFEDEQKYPLLIKFDRKWC